VNNPKKKLLCPIDKTQQLGYLLNMTTNPAQTKTELSAVKVTRKLQRLSDLISKYKHLWTESNRLYRWVDEYNQLRNQHYQIFVKFCENTGRCPTHTAHDKLA